MLETTLFFINGIKFTPTYIYRYNVVNKHDQHQRLIFFYQGDMWFLQSIYKIHEINTHYNSIIKYSLNSFVNKTSLLFNQRIKYYIANI